MQFIKNVICRTQKFKLGQEKFTKESYFRISGTYAINKNN